MKRAAPSSVDDYIAGCPDHVRAILQKMRAEIRAAAPGAEEVISYQMPTFRLHGNLVHFAAFKEHVGLYPGASAIREFRDDLEGFETSKGTIRFPFDGPIPWRIVKRIVRFRVAENEAKVSRKRGK